MANPTLRLAGKTYVVVERQEYRRLKNLARAAELPALPAPDAEGNYPAVAYARASLARKVIRWRAEAGLNQRELARRAGIPFETLCRIERGRQVPSMVTMRKIEQALQRAARQ